MKQSIRVKFAAIFGVIILLFILFSGLSFFLINRLNRSHLMVDLSKEIKIHMLEARRSEKDFFARSDLKYVEANKLQVDELLHHIDELLQLEDNPDHIEILKDLGDHTREYMQQFEEVKDLLVEKGLDENSGLRGSFRSATHEVEASIGKDNSDLLAALLMARRREKDYLLRGKSEYVTKFNEEIVTIRSLVNERLDNSAAINELLSIYRADFLKLVDINKQIDDKVAVFRENIHQIAPAIDEYTEIMVKNIADLNLSIRMTMIIAVVLVFTISSLIAFFFSGSISRMLRIITESALKIAEGDIKSEHEEITGTDEFGILSQSFTRMKEAINEKAFLVEQITKKDLSVTIKLGSDHDSLGKSLIVMKDTLNTIISQFYLTSQQVFSSSEQLSSTSLAMAEGATEQAGSLENISAAIRQVSDQAGNNTDNALQAMEHTKAAKHEADLGNQHMKKLVEAMSRINQSSEKIKKIVKTIDDIAFQINLLALNANVEAARAGKYGKGFAVVAEEVRNLANRSAGAVKETTALVDETIKNVENGNSLVSITSSQLEKIHGVTSQVSDIVDEIVAAGKEQNLAIDEIHTNLSGIETVTQSYSASAEESASTAVQLSTMAKQLNRLLSEFTLEQNRLSSQPMEQKKLLSQPIEQNYDESF